MKSYHFCLLSLAGLLSIGKAGDNPSILRCPRECAFDPCDCNGVDYDANCKICHDRDQTGTHWWDKNTEGCDQCDSYDSWGITKNTFKIDLGHPCEKCDDIFKHCKFCNDFVGCAQCEDGFELAFDYDECDSLKLQYCKQIDGWVAPQPPSWVAPPPSWVAPPPSWVAPQPSWQPGDHYEGINYCPEICPQNEWSVPSEDCQCPWNDGNLFQFNSNYKCSNCGEMFNHCDGCYANTGCGHCEKGFHLASDTGKCGISLQYCAPDGWAAPTTPTWTPQPTKWVAPPTWVAPTPKPTQWVAPTPKPTHWVAPPTWVAPPPSWVAPQPSWQPGDHYEGINYCPEICPKNEWSVPSEDCQCPWNDGNLFQFSSDYKCSNCDEMFNHCEGCYANTGCGHCEKGFHLASDTGKCGIRLQYCAPDGWAAPTVPTWTPQPTKWVAPPTWVAPTPKPTQWVAPTPKPTHWVAPPTWIAPPTWSQPTPKPTEWKPPTPHPTHWVAPTPKPTWEYSHIGKNPFIIECPPKCQSERCDCEWADRSDNCKICHKDQSCDQCIDEVHHWWDGKLTKIENFFYQSTGHVCESCQKLFGDACLHCNTGVGCGQCKEGFDLKRDDWACPGTSVQYCKPKDGHWEA